MKKKFKRENVTYLKIYDKYNNLKILFMLSKNDNSDINIKKK